MSVDMTEWLKALQHWQNSGGFKWPWGFLSMAGILAVVDVSLAYLAHRLDKHSGYDVVAAVLNVFDAIIMIVVLVGTPFMLLWAAIDVHTWENPPSGFQTQVEKAYNVDIAGSSTSVNGSTVRLAKNPVKLDSDTLSATVKDVRQANMPSDGTYNLDYINKDGRLHHGTLAIKDTTVTLYDENGEPVNPVKGSK